MEVILREDIKGVGKKGQKIDVKEGYAKNFLFPGKKAVPATEGEIKKIVKTQEDEKKKEDKIKEEAKKTAEKLNNKTVKMKVKSGKDGKTFGSISNKDIEELIQKSFGVVVDKKKIVLQEEHIKKVGNYWAEIKLHNEIKAKITIVVEAE